jgi:hypothetical protein
MTYKRRNSMEKTNWKDIAIVFIIWTVVFTVAITPFDKIGGLI